jgi:hypothetical protein
LWRIKQNSRLFTICLLYGRNPAIYSLERQKEQTSGRVGNIYALDGRVVHASDFESGVGDFRGNVTTRPFQGVQAGSLRNLTSFREALIWAQSNSDLEEYADKDMRQEELLSALSASRRFFGTWKLTHGKPPALPSNPLSEQEEYA